MEDVESALDRAKHNGISHVNLFNKQAEKIKIDAPNPEAILELEFRVQEMAKSFEETK